MKREKQLTAIGCILLTLITGCGTIDIASLPAESLATESEVSDFNKEQLNYAAPIERLGVDLEYGYTLKTIDPAFEEKLKSSADMIEKELGSAVYNTTNMHITEDLFNTFKGILDDKKLSGGNVLQVGSNKGYYFVDKKYKVTPMTVAGTPKAETEYLGLNGVYVEDAYHKVAVDTQYWLSFRKALNESDRKLDILINDASTLTSATARGTISINGVDQNKKDLGLKNTRRPKYNTTLANEVIGSSSTSLAAMPELTRVYQPVPKDASSQMAGYGIMLQGNKTMDQYGYDITKQQGTAYVRYVFKQHITEPDKIEFINAYMMNYTLNETPNTDINIIVPDFITTEASKLLSRADRCISNADLAGLMNGSIFADIGQAILTGYMNKYAYMDSYNTVLQGVVGRNQEHNSYLLKIRTVRDIGAKGGVDSGRYVYDGYAVMSQMRSTEFVITDYVYTQMQTVREPSVNLDDTIIRQLASLNLSGEIDDKTKASIETLLGSMYKSMTGNGSEKAPRYLTSEGNHIGYADCLTDDETLLPKDDKEYIVSKITGWITRYSATDNTVYSGFVSDWMGGNDSQAEFITQELIEYPDRGTGMYLKVYYLVNDYDDSFKVAEMRPLESKTVTGIELESIKEKIADKEEFIVDNPDNTDISKTLSTGTRNVAANKVKEAEKKAQAEGKAKSEADSDTETDNKSETKTK